MPATEMVTNVQLGRSICARKSDDDNSWSDDTAYSSIGHLIGYVNEETRKVVKALLPTYLLQNKGQVNAFKHEWPRYFLKEHFERKALQIFKL
jgi:hypothetical protein